MATAIANPNYAFNFNNFSIANLYYGTITEAGSSRVVVTVGNEAVTFTGSFVYSSPGTLAYGTITGVTDVISGVQVYSITDMNVNATSMLGWANTRDNNSAVNAIFGGADYIQTGYYGDYMRGFAGNDVMVMLDGNDTAYGDNGNDVLYGNTGQDLLYGGAGDDAVFGGKDNDVLFGEAGNDALFGDMDNDTVYGGDGGDVLRGGKANDWLYGEAGNDALWGDRGNDAIFGGAGGDWFCFAAESGQDVIADFSFAQGDRIGLASGMTYFIGSTALGEALVTFSPTDAVILSGVSPGQVTAAWFVAL